MREAVSVIQRALDLGVNYCDTAPAYASSMDYYGAALGDRRRGIFLASKTHDRTRDGSLRLLDESLRRLRTEQLDLWQLHDLRTRNDLDRIFAKGGALEALLYAREQGRVRFVDESLCPRRPLAAPESDAGAAERADRRRCSGLRVVVSRREHGRDRLPDAGRSR
jgi:aryl-alcohol dehydrogenase-like predicted oxidoreductase